MMFFLYAHQAKLKLELFAILPVQVIIDGLELIVMKNACQAGAMMDYFVGLKVSFHKIIKCLSKFPLLKPSFLLFFRILAWGRIWLVSY